MGKSILYAAVAGLLLGSFLSEMELRARVRLLESDVSTLRKVVIVVHDLKEPLTPGDKR